MAAYEFRCWGSARYFVSVVNCVNRLRVSDPTKVLVQGLVTGLVVERRSLWGDGRC